MFSVPSVTMKGGSLMRVTSRPLTRPNSAVTPMPQAIASGAGSPSSAANLVITMPPSAITMPQDRSMPAVRMIRVWPIAITPTTITCCRISEKFSPVRKRSLCAAKKAHASEQREQRAERAKRRQLLFQRVSMGFQGRLLLAPAQVRAGLDVLAVDAGHGLAAISVTPVSV